MPRISKPLIGSSAAVALAAVIRLQPTVGPLDATGQSALAVMAAAVVFWISDVLPAGITGLLALGVLIIAGVPSSVALSGFATGAFCVLVSVLFFGTAMVKTGLARRLSCQILLVSHPTYGGILSAFMVIGFVLALGVSSMTVRTSILVPIAIALVQAIRLPLPSRGSALIILSAFEMAVLPGCAVLTGSLWGALSRGALRKREVAVDLAALRQVMALPTVVWCGLVLGVNLLVMRPARTANMNSAVIRAEVDQLGLVTRFELLTALTVGAAVVAWAAQPWHGVPSEAIGMVALGALFATRVLTPSEIGTGIPWALAILVGAMLGLTAVMNTYRINVWMGGYIVPLVRAFVDSPFLLVVALTVSVATMRFVDPVGFITIAAFFLSLAGSVSGPASPLRGASAALRSRGSWPVAG